MGNWTRSFVGVGLLFAFMSVAAHADKEQDFISKDAIGIMCELFSVEFSKQEKEVVERQRERALGKADSLVSRFRREFELMTKIREKIFSAVFDGEKNVYRYEQAVKELEILEADYKKYGEKVRFGDPGYTASERQIEVARALVAAYRRSVQHERFKIAVQAVTQVTGCPMDPVLRRPMTCNGTSFYLDDYPSFRLIVMPTVAGRFGGVNSPEAEQLEGLYRAMPLQLNLLNALVQFGFDNDDLMGGKEPFEKAQERVRSDTWLRSHFIDSVVRRAKFDFRGSAGNEPALCQEIAKAKEEAEAKRKIEAPVSPKAEAGQKSVLFPKSQGDRKKPAE